MDALGVTAASTVVLYDGLGTFASPRAWWTFRVFGHHRWGLQAGAAGVQLASPVWLGVPAQ
jgi:thiosulfate/3-mercaptopyruvate sulfurtransferase